MLLELFVPFLFSLELDTWLMMGYSFTCYGGADERSEEEKRMNGAHFLSIVDCVIVACCLVD